MFWTSSGRAPSARSDHSGGGCAISRCKLTQKRKETTGNQKIGTLPTAAPQVYKGRRKCTGQITAMKFIMKHGKSHACVYTHQPPRPTHTRMHTHKPKPLNTHPVPEAFLCADLRGGAS